MTDMVRLTDDVLEAIAHNVCSLHGFDPAFVVGQKDFALAVITEYLRAAPLVSECGLGSSPAAIPTVREATAMQASRRLKRWASPSRSTWKACPRQASGEGFDPDRLWPWYAKMRPDRAALQQGAGR